MSSERILCSGVVLRVSTFIASLMSIEPHNEALDVIVYDVANVPISDLAKQIEFSILADQGNSLAQRISYQREPYFIEWLSW